MVKELGGSGCHSWSSRSGGGGGSNDGVFDDFESPYFPVLEEANKKIRETPKEDNNQVKYPYFHCFYSRNLSLPVKIFNLYLLFFFRY